MHRYAMRGFAVIPALAALMALTAGCSSSGHNPPPQTSPTTSSTGTSSMSPTAAACQKIQATLGQAPATLGKAVIHPSSVKPQVIAFVNKLKSEAAAAGDAALTSAVDQFGNSVQQALTSLRSNPGSVSTLISQLTKDSQKIVTTCTHAAG